VTDIIEHGDAGNNRVVRVGETHSQVSLKIYQDIYHQVTGRTEQIRKRYSDNLLVDISELEQLHHKVGQLCDVHNVVARNASITVFHDKERKEQFTSFERFRAYNGNTASPTVNVVLKYNFSLIPAGLERPQEYVVTVRLTSRIAAIRQIEDEAPPFMRGRLFGFVGGPVAEITVEYADYVVARGFLEAFEEWVRGCKSNPKSKFLAGLKRYSHWTSPLLQLAGTALITFFALQAIPSVFVEGTGQAVTARFVVVFAGGAYILLKLTHIAGEFIEETIDGFPEISYLRLNKGDDRLIEVAERAKPFALLRIAIGAIGSIALGIVSSKLENFL
jgi:hypothetical protein